MFACFGCVACTDVPDDADEYPCCVLCVILQKPFVSSSKFSQYGRQHMSWLVHL